MITRGKAACLEDKRLLRAAVSAEETTGFRVVSAAAWPYAARLDGCAKLQGMSSSMRAFGWPSRMARRVVEM